MKLHPLAEYWFSVLQRSSDFKIFLFFFLHHQLFETNQNTEETLSILMGLRESDRVRTAKVKNKTMWESVGSGLCKSGNLSIPTSLSYELIESKIEYRIEFYFEYFKSILQ